MNRPVRILFPRNKTEKSVFPFPSFFYFSEVPSTKIRSRLVGLSMTGFALGSITLNLISFLFTTADHLIQISTLLVFICMVPIFFNVVEPPMFLFRKGRVTKMIKSLLAIAKKNKSWVGSEGYFKERLKLQAIDVDLEDPIEVEKDLKQKPPAVEIEFFRYTFSKRQNLVNQLGLLANSAICYMLYYGVVVGVQDLGLNSIQLNGMLLSTTSLTTFCITTVISPKIRRVRTAKLCCLGEIFFAGMLLVLSFVPTFSGIKVLRSIISAVFIQTISGFHISMLYLMNAELLPTQIRGISIAFTLVFGKFMGSFSPALGELSKNLGVHVLVGCSSMALVALPFNFFVQETFGAKKMK